MSIIDHCKIQFHFTCSFSSIVVHCHKLRSSLCLLKHIIIFIFCFDLSRTLARRSRALNPRSPSGLLLRRDPQQGRGLRGDHRGLQEVRGHLVRHRARAGLEGLQGLQGQQGREGAEGFQGREGTEGEQRQITVRYHEAGDEEAMGVGGQDGEAGQVPPQVQEAREDMTSKGPERALILYGRNLSDVVMQVNEHPLPFLSRS